MLLQRKSAKSLVAAPTFELSMARTSANYIGPFSIKSLISMLPCYLEIVTKQNRDKPGRFFIVKSHQKDQIAILKNKLFNEKIKQNVLIPIPIKWLELEPMSLKVDKMASILFI
jgi:hypothetical protein